MLDANPTDHEFQVRAATGPRMIAVGLAILIAAAWIPELPVVTAVAILTLGATNAVIARFRASPALVAAVLLHAAAYVGLYALFIGATLYAGAHPSAHGLGASAICDLAVSTLPMAVALQRMATTLARLGGTP
jgi:hypothetical protein